MEDLQTDLSVSAEIKLYYDLHLPENLNNPVPLMVAVHGYGAHKRYMMREAKLIAPKNFAIVSLQAPNQHFQPKDDGYRIGFGWLTDYKPEESVALHHKFVLDVIEKLVNDGLVDENKIYLYGFSQACALNFRFAFTHPDVMCGVLGVCGGIPGDLATSNLYKPTNADIFYLYSRSDNFYPLEKFEQYDTKLKDYLPNYESKSYKAKHEITDEMRNDMKNWLTEKEKI
jgi:predicted esterase